MVAKLVLVPEVEQDLAEAYGWYESHRLGLGEEFLSCVDSSIQRIVRLPELHAKVHEDYRRSLIRRFPYAIFYEYAGRTVMIFCVFHTSRDPSKWRERLP